jgi:hypothetical protein
LQAHRGQRTGIHHHAELVDHRQRGETGRQRLELRRGIERAVVALLTGIHQHRATATGQRHTA